MALMRFVGPDLLGQGQVRTLRALLDQIGPEAANVLVVAIARSRAEQRFTAHVMALISVAINEVESGDRVTAHAAAVEAVITAESFGLAA